MANFIMLDKDELQDFFNIIAGNSLYLAENIKNFRDRNLSKNLENKDIEVLAFIAATTEITAELIETVTDFGNAHGLVKQEGDDDDDDGIDG